MSVNGQKRPQKTSPRGVLPAIAGRMGGALFVGLSGIGLALLGVLASGVFVPRQARAQVRPPQPGAEDMIDLVTLADRADRLLQRARYKDAAPLFRQLAKNEPDNMVYQLSLARCLFEIGKKGGQARELKRSMEVYAQVLEEEPNNVVARLQMARVKALLSGRPGIAQAERLQLLADSRHDLVSAARHGARALRAIFTLPELSRHFRDDIDLQLNLIHAPQRRGRPRAVRDPFRSPLVRVGSGGEGRGLDLRGGEKKRLTRAEQRKLVRRLRGMLARIDPLLKERDFPGIQRIWQEISQLLKEDEAITELELQRELERLRRLAGEKTGVVRQFMLRAYYLKGERIIADMEIALNESKHARVIELWQDLNRHGQQMSDTHSSFKRTAATLLAKGRKFYNDAKVLAEIKMFPLKISGVVVGTGVAEAIVNDRWVVENGNVYGADRLPIPGVRVVKIKRRRVRFSYKDIEFERALDSTKTE